MSGSEKTAPSPRRLGGARRDLGAVDMAGSRVADTAARGGFATQAHVPRLFRARFGCTPSEVRLGGAADGVTGG
jgi:AraC-like DNA-binding protein